MMNQLPQTLRTVVFPLFMVVGCAHTQPPARTLPAPHPTLDAADWALTERSEGLASRTRPGRSPTPRRPINQRVVKNLDGIAGDRFNDVTQSPELIREAFAGTPASPSLAKVRSVSEIRLLTEPIRGSGRPGDLIFFQAVSNMTPVGVLRRQRADGTLEVLAINRGRVRLVKAHVHYRSRRRSKGRVLNTFLRVKKPGDAGRSPYLAGQLITTIRRLPHEVETP